MYGNKNAGLLAQAGEVRGEAGGLSRSQYSMDRSAALAVFKGQRWITVAKIIDGEGEPILGIVVRGQVGTRYAISLPPVVLDHAQAVGCRWLYYRRDRERLMGRIRIEDVLGRGWVGVDGEVYVLLKDFESTPWRWWPYVENVERLTDAKPQREERQAAALAQGSLL